MLMKEGESI